MPADPPAFFLVLVVSTLVDALLLLWCWLQNRSDRTLVWASGGFASAAVGNLLLMGRGKLPDVLSIDSAVTLVLVGYSFAWVAAVAFNGRRVRLETSLIGAALWLCACRLPSFYQSYDARLILTAMIIAGYGLMAAKEFWRRDGLRSRYPIAVAMVVHSAMVLARIPVAMTEMRHHAVVAFASPSFDLMAIEAMIFAQSIAFLFISLTKERVEAQLRHAALTDSLTGLSNRRALFEDGRSLMAQSVRNRQPVSLAVFDLDGFKQINDAFGHPIGDAVIQRFADAARASLRSSDLIGRIGGEEFVAILPQTGGEDACFITRRLMATFAALAAEVEGCRTEATASAGIMTSSDASLSLEELLGLADRALYEAKRKGRDSLRVSSLPPLPQIMLSRAS
ncbi:MAG TPA: GGDEF domain-containing protein [Beijerinckiaceae bacterium]|nr:GGDEF domain-containing protein [Beijerinckiaceae bacterium]